MQSSTVSIPTYDLYGRPEGWPGPEPVFCEALEISNRRYSRDYRIRAHRHLNLFQFFCFSGGATVIVDLDGHQHRLRPPAALLVAPMSVHGFVFTPDSRGFILTCPEFALAEFLFLSAADAERLNRSAAVGNQPDREFARLESDFAALLEEFNGDRAARLQALRARALPVVLWFIRSLLQNEHAPASNGENRGIGLVNRFLGLVNAHFREQRPLSYYAGELRISGTHLNRLTRQHLGSTASAVICERVLLEAQRELAYTNRTVSAIAYALGYRDPAYFTRLFTRNVGMTPTAYRRKMEAL